MIRLTYKAIIISGKFVKGYHYWLKIGDVCLIGHVCLIGEIWYAV